MPAGRRDSRRGVAAARRTLVSAMAGVLLLATSGLAVAASGAALPGDPLYSVKRASERVQLLLILEPASGARLHLDLARQRLAEAVAIAGTRPAALPQVLEAAVEELERAEDMGEGAMTADAAAVRAEASGVLAEVAGGVEPALAVALEQVAERLGTPALAEADEAQPGPEPPAAPPGERPRRAEPEPEREGLVRPELGDLAGRLPGRSGPDPAGS
jgi:hypothetical protein